MRFGLISKITYFSDGTLARRLRLWWQHMPRNEAHLVREVAEIRERIAHIKHGGGGDIDQDVGVHPPAMAFNNLWDLFFAFSRGNSDQTDAGARDNNQEVGLNKVGEKEPDSNAVSTSESLTPHIEKGQQDSERPLSGLLRHRMEGTMGVDLADVRIHTNAETARQVQRGGADAVTVGDTIYFAPGKYNPESRRGRALLVHELTHVRQQKQLANSDATFNQTRLQQFEQEALNNEIGALMGSDSLPNASTHLGKQHGLESLSRSGNSAKNLRPPAPVLFHPILHGLAQNKSTVTSWQSTQNAASVMAAATDRDIDPAPPDSNKAQPEQADFTDRTSAMEDVYDALKWRLKTEKERSGD